MSNVRVIKKYPNRRLYDTELSRYVTQMDLRGLVMKGTSFQVVDTQSEEDLTRSVLLQIMLEEESGGKPLFSANMLSQMLRFYGGSVQGVFAKFLEESLSMFVDQQEKMTQSWSTDPMKAMSSMADNNMRIWNDMQKNVMGSNPFMKSSKEKESS